jgi:protein-S-isoprenylcysteine O-methyltransferase Ste14
LYFIFFYIFFIVFIFCVFILLYVAWKFLYYAYSRYTLATTGVYEYVRLAQYVGFIVIMLGFLLQWPTLLTLLMFPVLLVMYVKLARMEEREALAEFGAEYERYMRAVPGFIPRLGDLTGGPRHGRAGDRPTGEP